MHRRRPRHRFMKAQTIAAGGVMNINTLKWFDRAEDSETVLEFVKLSRADQLYAIRHMKSKWKFPAFLEWIDPDQQFPELCEAAVYEDPMAIRFVKEQTPELCRKAVEDDWRSIKHVRDQSTDLCLTAIRLSGNARTTRNTLLPIFTTRLRRSASRQ